MLCPLRRRRCRRRRHRRRRPDRSRSRRCRRRRGRRRRRHRRFCRPIYIPVSISIHHLNIRLHHHLHLNSHLHHNLRICPHLHLRLHHHSSQICSIFPARSEARTTVVMPHRGDHRKALVPPAIPEDIHKFSRIRINTWRDDRNRWVIDLAPHQWGGAVWSGLECDEIERNGVCSGMK